MRVKGDGHKYINNFWAIGFEIIEALFKIFFMKNAPFKEKDYGRPSRYVMGWPRARRPTARRAVFRVQRVLWPQKPGTRPERVRTEHPKGAKNSTRCWKSHGEPGPLHYPRLPVPPVSRWQAGLFPREDGLYSRGIQGPLSVQRRVKRESIRCVGMAFSHVFPCPQ